MNYLEIGGKKLKRWLNTKWVKPQTYPVHLLNPVLGPWRRLIGGPAVQQESGAKTGGEEQLNFGLRVERV